MVLIGFWSLRSVGTPTPTLDAALSSFFLPRSLPPQRHLTTRGSPSSFFHIITVALFAISSIHRTPFAIASDHTTPLRARILGSRACAESERAPPRIQSQPYWHSCRREHSLGRSRQPYLSRARLARARGTACSSSLSPPFTSRAAARARSRGGARRGPKRPRERERDTQGDAGSAAAIGQGRVVIRTVVCRRRWWRRRDDDDGACCERRRQRARNRSKQHQQPRRPPPSLLAAVDGRRAAVVFASAASVPS